MGLLTSISPIKDTNGLLVENDLDKAELFNNFFHSVYISDDDNAPPFDNRTNVIMPTPTFTIVDVKKPSLNLRTLLRVVLMGVLHYY